MDLAPPIEESQDISNSHAHYINSPIKSKAPIAQQ